MKKLYSTFSLLIISIVFFVGCNKEDQLFNGTDNSLTSFSITANGVTYKAAITDNEVILSAPQGADLSGGTVQYNLCEQSSIVPDPATISNWNSSYVFRVRSHSKEPREYTYSVLRTDISEHGNVALITQSDVDAFAKLGVTVIDGNLLIGSDSKPVEDSIVDLGGLGSLKEVRYNIIINRSFAGGTLEGLENIQQCGGIHIGSTSTQIEFPATSGLSIDLPNLKSVGDIVLNSSSIKSLSLEKLELASSLFLSSNSLVALNVPLLRETVGGVNLDNSSSSINSILSEISFPELEKIGGKLSMQWFSALTSVNLPKLTYIGGSVNVALNSSTLEALSFPQTTTINGAVMIEKAPGLLSFAMPKIKHVLSFSYNQSSYGSYPLNDLNLESLETIEKELYIRGVSMEHLNLPKLTEVGKDITIWDLKSATSIALPSIKKIGGKLQFYGANLLDGLDISTLDKLDKFELIGCLSLKTVKSPATIGDLTINYASNATCLTPLFEGLQHVEGTLYFTSDSKTTAFDVKHIKTVGTLKFGGGASGATLNLFDVEKISNFDLSSSKIVTLHAPKLSEVENLNFSYIEKLTTLNIPALKTVGTFSLSEHNKWGTSSARMTNLDAYSGITSIGKVTISYCNKLMDFSGLSNIIATLEQDKWSVSDCEYNPTYQDMVEGRYTKP